MRLTFVIILLMAGMKCMADTHYVSLSGTNNSPYTTWADAATNPIWAVAEAGSGDTVLVSNGVYYMTNQINDGTSLTLRSVNGRDVTILNGANATTSRCLNLTSASAVFDGFTVTNYSTKGNDGVLVGATFLNCTFISNRTSNIGINTGGRGMVTPLSGGVISNCIFKYNVNNYGGGIYGGADHNLKILGCRFEGNSGTYGGGCVLNSCTNAIVSNCVFTGNNGQNRGGGVYILYGLDNSVLNCTVISNVVNSGDGKGAGINMYYSGIIKDCTIVDNTAKNAGGGIHSGEFSASGSHVTIINCLIARNQASTNVGGGVWLGTGTVENCTIVSNYAQVAGGGFYISTNGGGTNNIIYFNTADIEPSAANFTNTSGNTGLNYCCVIPAVDGAGNITNDPALKDLAGGDYRLRLNSPCVNAGTNQPWMTGAVDLDGNARIRYGIVDLGAYEAVLRQGNIYRVH